MTVENYSIGQVLFVVSNKKIQVYPVQVIEVIHKKTLRGEDIKYLLQDSKDKNSTVLLDEVDGEVFDSAEKVRMALIDRATRQINNIVDVAVKNSRDLYTSKSEKEKETETIENLPDLNSLRRDSSTIDSSEIAEVMLPDGTIAKIKLPTAV